MLLLSDFGCVSVSALPRMEGQSDEDALDAVCGETTDTTLMQLLWDEALAIWNGQRSAQDLETRTMLEQSAEFEDFAILYITN